MFSEEKNILTRSKLLDEVDRQCTEWRGGGPPFHTWVPCATERVRAPHVNPTGGEDSAKK